MSKKENPDMDNGQEDKELDIENESREIAEPRYFKRVESIREKLVEKDKMKPETKREAELYITNEGEETALDFMREFVNDNKDQLKIDGVWSEEMSNSTIADFAKKLNWKEALEEDDKYEKYRESLQHFDYLGHNFSKENVPQEAKFLMVNKLNGAIEKREEQLIADKKDINSDPELKKLYSLAEKISSGISGQDIREEETRRHQLLSKEDVVSQSLDAAKERLKTVIDDGGKASIGSTEDALKRLGYDVKINSVGLFKREIAIYGKDENGDLKKIKTFKAGFFSEVAKNKKQFETFLESKLGEEARQILENYYDQSFLANNETINREVKERIKKIASSTEKAEGGIKAFFENANEKDIKEEEERVEKKRLANAKKKEESKTKEAKQNKPKEKESKQEDSWNKKTRDAMDIVYSLGDVPEDFGDGFEVISDVLKKAGYETADASYFEKDEWFQNNIAARYSEVMKNKGKNKKQYNGWLIQFLTSIITNFSKK